MRGFLIVLLLLTVYPVLTGQDACPQPRVKVANDLDYYDTQSRTDEAHLLLSINTAVANSIMGRNARDIRFFSAFSAAVPIDEVDYHMSVGSHPVTSGVTVMIKMVDNNNRMVISHQRTIQDDLWHEHLNSIADALSNEVSPLINKIKAHQHKIRNNTLAAISSKFHLDRRSFTLEPEEEKKVSFVLKDCDDVLLPDRTVALELEGEGEIDKTSCTVD